ncbi:MAG: hypothetical protein ND895_15395 [Pyrinomonadaceae bacterium]|nr:hypothetical protein [Pyrinomonadaceae bacterium]
MISGSVSASLVVILFLAVYAPSWVLTVKANAGDANAQYELARWTENHCEQIGEFVLWPCQADVLGGYAWLEKSAGQEYPPALYAVGVRLKYGEHVPQPPEWSGPGGNVFPQPERGQKKIDRALALGFHPPVEEEYFYWRVYRR